MKELIEIEDENKRISKEIEDKLRMENEEIRSSIGKV